MAKSVKGTQTEKNLLTSFAGESQARMRYTYFASVAKKEERAKRLKEKNNIEVDANFFKNKIVCIWDDVVTTGTSFCDYTAKLEQVGARVTNGIFLGKTSYKYVQQ